MFGTFFPSKVQPLTLTAPVPLPLRGNSTISVSGSLIWYITANSVSSPGVFTARVTNPLGPANPGVNILFCTGDGNATAAAYGNFVRVTPNALRLPTAYPPQPFWINTANIMDLYEDVNSGKRMIVAGTDSASDMFLVDETLAALTAAINTAANPPTSTNVLSVVPAGTDQATATRVPIVRGAGDYTVFVGGISSGATDGIRIEMVAEDGTTIIPAVLNTRVTVYSSAILTNDIAVYPQVGGGINGEPANAPWVLNRGSSIELLCTAPNIWEIQGDEFGRVEATEVIQGNTATQLLLGNAAGLGVVVRGLGGSTTHLGLTDPNFGLKFVSNTVEVINTGATAAVFYSTGLVRIGGDVTGSPGSVVSTPASVIPTTAGVGVGSPLTMVVETITGANAFVQHNGDPGNETTYWNLHPTDSFEFKDQVGTTIGLPIPAQSYVTFRSYNQGANWSQGTILSV